MQFGRNDDAERRSPQEKRCDAKHKCLLVVRCFLLYSFPEVPSSVQKKEPANGLEQRATSHVQSKDCPSADPKINNEAAIIKIFREFAALTVASCRLLQKRSSKSVIITVQHFFILSNLFSFFLLKFIWLVYCRDHATNGAHFKGAVLPLRKDSIVVHNLPSLLRIFVLGTF